jgi:nifR3 family TIM-barrel protein
MESFWKRLPKPFFALAPMADVTDPAYRKIIAKCGKPDVMWTEFVAADGLYATRERHSLPLRDSENPLMRDLQFDESEHPIVAQIFGSNPETIAYAAKLVAELGFDGVDLNMGCPDRAIEKQKSGAAMMKTPEKAREIIRAAKTAGIPVSVKTRIGYSKETMDEWLSVILEEKPDALTVHLRTRKEMSLVPAHWNLMPRAVVLRDRISPETVIIGNGDVRNLDDARAKAVASGCDGIMLGRAIFGNPWLFENLNVGRQTSYMKSGAEYTHREHGLDEKLAVLTGLAREFEKLHPAKSFHILKKHIKAFVTGFSGASELRAKLMETENADGLERIILDMNKGTS